MYVLSAFSFALPEAVEILAEAFWRPGLSIEEVCLYFCISVLVSI